MEHVLHIIDSRAALGLVEATFKKAGSTQPHLASSSKAQGSLKIVRGCGAAPSDGNAV